MGYNPYRPNYKKLYSGLNIGTSVLTALQRGDRKEEYMEHDLKCAHSKRDAKGKVVLDDNGQPVMLPERETPFDELNAAENAHLRVAPSAEDVVIRGEFPEREELYRCLGELETDERELIEALFFEGLTQEEYAARAGLSRQKVGRNLKKILAKLKKLWEF